MERYRVAIVESSQIIAEGLKTLLSRSANIEVVLTCDSLAELTPMMATADIDVVMLDITQSIGYDSLGDVPLIGIQTSLVDSQALRPFHSVVNIYSSSESVERAILDATQSAAEKSPAESHELSERERDVLVLVAQGMTNKEIASKLFISPHTVISHRKNIVHKTGIRSVAGLTVYAVLNKLIDSE